MKKNIVKCTPILLLLLLPFLLFYPIFQDKIIVTGDFSGSDLLDLHLPFKYALHDAIANRKLPLWEKDLAMGFPLLAEGQTGVFYPVNAILALIPPVDSLNLSVIAVFIISGLTSYLFFRSSKKSPLSSLYGAIIFAYSGYFVTRFKHLNMVNVASLFPLLLLFAKKYFDTENKRYIIFSSITFALMIFAGHPQITFYNAFIFLIFSGHLAFKRSKINKSFAVSGFINIVLVTAILGILLSAVQILPTIELTLKSPRAESGSASFLYPFKPIHLMTFISPYYFGNPAEATYNRDIRSFGIFWENTSYMSLTGIIFALIMIARIVLKKDRDQENRFFLGSSILSLLLMFGSYTPIFPLIFNSIPLINLFRFPNRFNLYLIFSLAYLSVGGLDFILSKIDKFKNRSEDKPREASTSEEQLQLNWPFSVGQTTLLIIAFTVLDLFVFGSAYIGYLPADEAKKEPEIVESLKENSKMYRTYSTTQYTDNPYSLLGWKKDTSAILDSRKTLPPNNNLLFNIPSFTDRGWFEGGLSVSRRNNIENYLLNANGDPFVTAKVLGMYSVKYILSYSDISGSEIYKEKDFNLGKEFGVKLNLLRNDMAIPRVSFVPEADYQTDEKAVFGKINTLEHNPAKTVILEDKPKIIPDEFKGALDNFKKDNQVNIIKDENSQTVISADITNHGFLVLSDIYYPGWKVKVDGKEDKILRANYLARAVELDPGHHKVIFYFDPISFKLGAGISIITFVFILLYIFHNTLKSKLKSQKSK